MTTIHNPHAGDILKHEFLEPAGLSQNALAKTIAVPPPNRIHAIVHGTRRVKADTDLRLCHFFRLSEGYFLRLQNAYETLAAKRQLKSVLVGITPYEAVNAS